MSDTEEVTEFESLKDLFKGVFKKVTIDEVEYIMIPHSKMQRVIDFILTLDIIIRQLQEATGLKEKEKTYSSEEVDEMLKQADERGEPIWGNEQKRKD